MNVIMGVCCVLDCDELNASRSGGCWFKGSLAAFAICDVVLLLSQRWRWGGLGEQMMIVRLVVRGDGNIGIVACLRRVLVTAMVFRFRLRRPYMLFILGAPTAYNSLILY